MQFRLAWDEHEKSKLQPQLYNAFINMKAREFDVWVGHNKPALGLSSYLDNHALLLSDNSMSGLAFDRDWGIGMVMDRSITSFRTSLTTGSGMPLYAKGNYLWGARLGYKDISRDNYTLGISASRGKILKSMGYEIMHGKKQHELMTGGFDASLRYLDWEAKTDLQYGSYDTDPAHALLGRLSHYLLPEDRASIEIQALLGELKGARTQEYSAGLMYRISADFTIRAAYSWQEPASSQALALQIYYYKGIVF